MSIHPVTAPVDRLRSLCDARLRLPSNVTGDPQTGAISFVFTPDLSAGEVATFADLHAAALNHVDISPDEWAALKPLIAQGKAFMALPTPTSAQNAAAIKGILQVLDIIFRS